MERVRWSTMGICGRTLRCLHRNRSRIPRRSSAFSHRDTVAANTTAPSLSWIRAWDRTHRRARAGSPKETRMLTRGRFPRINFWLRQTNGWFWSMARERRRRSLLSRRNSLTGSKRARSFRWIPRSPARVSRPRDSGSANRARS